MRQTTVIIDPHRHLARDTRRKLNRARICQTCGEMFSVARSDSKSNKCPDCSSLITFIGVDGEGTDCKVCGDHHYDLLGVGQEQIEVTGCNSLGWEEIFTLLYSQFKNYPKKNTAFIGFSLGYDFNQWLCQRAGFPEVKAWHLLTKKGQALRKPKSVKRCDPFPVRIQGKHGVWETNKIGNRLAIRPKTCECPGEEHLTMRLQKETGRLCTQGQTPFMYVCDVFDYWQTSFLNVIDKAGWNDGAIASDDEYAIIEVGKDQRSGDPWKPSGIQWFDSLSDSEKRKAYNRLENELLARVMTKLNNDGIRALDVKLTPSRWFGPGQAAQQWMQNHDVPLRVDIAEKLPHDFIQAARMSYFGGWFEIMVHGHIPGETYGYDLNSAYTDAMPRLPCLFCGSLEYSGQPLTTVDMESLGLPNSEDIAPLKADKPLPDDYLKVSKAELRKLRHHEDEAMELPPLEPGQFRLVYADVEGSDPYIGPMPYRHSPSEILRPTASRGWFWQHELEASKSAGLIDTIEAFGYFTYTVGPPCEHTEWATDLAGLYERRLRVGKNTARGKAYKVVYHSVYGKFAETVGDNPKFTNFIYASLITADIRCRILEAIATHPMRSAAVTMVATDGVNFLTPHPSIDAEVERYLSEWNAEHPDRPKSKDDRLGYWEKKESTNLTQFKPGMYWDDEARDGIRHNTRLTFKGRGVNRKALSKRVADIDAQFRSWSPEPRRMSGRIQFIERWPHITLETDFAMVTCLQAVIMHRWDLSGKIGKAKTTQNSDPEKKRTGVYYDPGRDIYRSRPWPHKRNITGHFTASMPYEKGMSLRETVRNYPTIDPLQRETPGGTVQFLFKQTGLMGQI